MAGGWLVTVGGMAVGDVGCATVACAFGVTTCPLLVADVVAGAVVVLADGT